MFISLSGCLSVCLSVYPPIHPCMYVCLCMYEYLYMYVWMQVGMCVYMNVCMYVCMYVCMFLSMYIYIYITIIPTPSYLFLTFVFYSRFSLPLFPSFPLSATVCHFLSNCLSHCSCNLYKPLVLCIWLELDTFCVTYTNR